MKEPTYMKKWKNNAGMEFEIKPVPVFLRELIARQERKKLPPKPTYTSAGVAGDVEFEHDANSINSDVATDEAKEQWQKYSQAVGLVEIGVAEKWLEKTIRLGLGDIEPTQEFVQLVVITNEGDPLSDEELKELYLWGHIAPTNAEKNDLFSAIGKISFYDEEALGSVIEMFQVIRKQARGIFRKIAQEEDSGA